MELEALRKSKGPVRADTRFTFDDIVAQSESSMLAKERAMMGAPTNSTILLLGESGVGKEVFAHAIHNLSPRYSSPFVRVNCSAITETLFESELFGYADGAFTGAKKGGRSGKFELANGGTIFLDEIGDMPLATQSKLLRVLQEREIDKVGGEGTIPVDVRVIAATNQDLWAQVEQKKFRRDLFFRLNVIPIVIPPLRDRREAIPFLVEHFLAKYDAEYGKNVRKMSREVLDAMLEYDWPGNVRELESCIERAVVLSQDGVISMSLLPVSILSFREKRAVPEPAGPPEEVIGRMVRGLRARSAGELRDLHEQVMATVEKCLLEDVLEANGHVQTRSAHELGLSRNTLRRKMKDYGIPFR
jgi:transcriptional regulator with PAS, ATPase and Fis domain